MLAMALLTVMVLERKKAPMVFGGHYRTDKRCHGVVLVLVMMVIEKMANLDPKST